MSSSSTRAETQTHIIGFAEHTPTHIQEETVKRVAVGPVIAGRPPGGEVSRFSSMQFLGVPVPSVHFCAADFSPSLIVLVIRPAWLYKSSDKPYTFD